MLAAATALGYVAMVIAAVIAFVATMVLLGGHILLKPAKDAWVGTRYAAPAT